VLAATSRLAQALVVDMAFLPSRFKFSQKMFQMELGLAHFLSYQASAFLETTLKEGYSNFQCISRFNSSEHYLHRMSLLLA
jgi:hypothetical protein